MGEGDVESVAAQRPQRDTTEAERDRAYKRAWRERNAEHIREYRAAYNEAHREEIRAKNREYMRQRAAEQRAEEARRERRRAYSREYYAKNKDAYLEYQRQARARRKAEDPERYLELSRGRQRRWYDKHREERQAHSRETYEQNADVLRVRSSRFYAANRDRILERHRRRREENPDEVLAQQRAYRSRERRRREAGLPPRRLHRVPVAERRANGSAAKEFFTRIYTPEQVDAMRDVPTDPADLSRWHRDCARARAAAYLAEAPDVHARARAEEARRLVKAVHDAEARRIQDAEDARLDGIARTINDRLRQHPRQSGPLDPAFPHHGPHSPQQPGLSR